MILASLLLLVSCASVQATPDIVIFVMDDVAAADLALYGGSISCPNIEALAAQGVKFTRCYANPTCAPTRRSILTGHWWLTGNGEPCTDAQENTPPLSEAFLPECLPEYTSGIIGKWHLGGNQTGLSWELAPQSQGFTLWGEGIAGNVTECGGSSYTSWMRTMSSLSTHSSALSSSYAGTAPKALFNSLWPNAESPKLSYVSPQLAHSPFHDPPPGALPPGYQIQTGTRGKFEAMVVAWDHALGSMLERIDLETTLVVVVGDNGTPPQVAPIPSKAKGSTFERGAVVPLLVAGMGVDAPGRTESELVHVLDIWATLIEIGSGSIPGGLPYQVASESLVPILTQQTHNPLHDFVLIGSRWGETDGDIASVSASGKKLRWLDPDGNGVVNTEELYDLALDPGETVNQVANPAYAADLAAARAFILASIP